MWASGASARGCVGAVGRRLARDRPVDSPRARDRPPAHLPPEAIQANVAEHRALTRAFFRGRRGYGKRPRAGNPHSQVTAPRTHDDWIDGWECGRGEVMSELAVQPRGGAP